MRVLHNCCFRKSPGFTLVEILIVISIMSILCMLLFPAFSRIRERGRRIACASNLRQIGVAYNQYLSDYDNFMPYTPIAPQCSWPDFLLPYTHSTQLFHCPSSAKGDLIAGCPTMECNVDGNCDNHYGTYDRNHLSGAYSTANEAVLTHPSMTINALDGSGLVLGIDGSNCQTPEALAANSVLFQHDKGDNVLFIDGHVKWLAATTLTDANLWIP